MNTIKLPKELTYIGAFLTFRCGFKCTYCINRHGKLKPRKELTPGQWIEGLGRFVLDKKQMLPITLSGGEPSQYNGWLGIIKQLSSKFYIDVLTNLDFDIKRFMHVVKPEMLQRDVPYASIRVSYHLGFSKVETLFRIKQMQDRGYSIGLFGMDHPGIGNIEWDRNNPKEFGIDFRRKEFLGKYKGKLYGKYKYPDALKGKLKNAQCKTTELLIAPDGNIHKCHRDLYAGEYPLGNILDKDLKVEFEFRKCEKPECNPCDIKVKNNRFQEFGTCSVEIKKEVNINE